MSEWLRKSGRTVERRQNTPSGGPRFRVIFDDGTQFATADDSQVAHVITNSEFDGAVEIQLGAGGRITGIRVADE